MLSLTGLMTGIAILPLAWILRLSLSVAPSHHTRLLDRDVQADEYGRGEYGTPSSARASWLA